MKYFISLGINSELSTIEHPPLSKCQNAKSRRIHHRENNVIMVNLFITVTNYYQELDSNYRLNREINFTDLLKPPAN